jgi:5'-3' exoribonuclease 1
MLSPEEKNRNQKSEALIYFHSNESANRGFSSFYPLAFPNFQTKNCKVETFDFGERNKLRAINYLCPGALVGKNLLSGFPSLKTLDYKFKIGFHGVNVFKVESKYYLILI